MQKTAIIINGPTAVGKTDLAIQLAQYFNTEIISSDSRQCYREPNIGVAKPDGAQLAAVPHHFINSHSIHQEVNAASFEHYALACADKIFSKHDVLILVGGTGLYTKAFCEGLDNIPSVPPALKAGILQRYETGGDEWLRREIEKEDPEFYRLGEIQNPRRILRALEVKMATGKSIRDFQTREKSDRNFLTVQIGLEIERHLLYERINTRVDKMMDAGLVEEAKILHPEKQLTALQTVGYREIFDWIDGLISLDRAIDLIKVNTRHYAKRQMTWFKNQSSLHWVSFPFNVENLIRDCVSFTHYAAK